HEQGPLAAVGAARGRPGQVGIDPVGARQWPQPAPKITYRNVNRNSQTTSTKCQYQAAASKPKCFWGEKPPFISRIRHTVRKIEPTIRWKPWKPVAMKKVEPYRPELGDSGP